MPSLPDLLALKHRVGATMTLSVYVSDELDESTGQLVGVRTLAHALEELRESVATASHAEREAVNDALEHLQRLIEAESSRIRFSGLMAFITADGVQHAELVHGPMPTVAVWGSGISIAPALPIIDRLPVVAVAVVDSSAVHLYTREAGRLVDVEVLRVDAHHDVPRHMGTPARLGFHPGTRGTTATDAAQRLREVGRRQLARRTVTRLLQLTPSNGLILIGGIARAATDILLSLPSSRRSQAMLLRGLDIHASPAVIARHVDQALEEWQEGTDHEEVQRLADHYLGRGRASLGERQTLMALQRGAVEQLYVSEAFLLQHLDATESVLQLAVAHRARIACVKGSAAETLTRTGGGVAARLRFSPPASTIDREQATIRV